jgi:Uncharacterized protein conserved in bacteria (DUF2188)
VRRQGDVHVLRDKNGGWLVRVEGALRPRSTHESQAQASRAGRELARKNRSELFVHGPDGKIRERSTFGRDPRQTEG